MTAATYTTDLADIDDASDESSWAEPTAVGWTGASGGPEDDGRRRA